HEDKGGRGPVVGLVDWPGGAVPRRPSALPLVVSPWPDGLGKEPAAMGWILFGDPADPTARLQTIADPRRRVVGKRTRRQGGPERTHRYVGWWKRLDEWFSADG